MGSKQSTESIVVMLTNAYPYTDKELFPENELPYLLKYFKKIIIIPLSIQGEARPVPDNVEVLSHFAFENSKKSFCFKLKKTFSGLRCSEFYCEMYRNPKIVRNRRYFIHHLGICGLSYRGYLFLKNLLKKQPELQNALFYSYWLHAHAAIPALLKEKKYPSLQLISRAHGYDIYPRDYFPPFYSA